MADYPDRVQPSSFRGVPFTLLAVEGAGGRRLVRHVGTDRDGASLEDVGLKEHDISVRGMISGPSVHSHWQQLLGAIEQGGPGVFVHPSRGALTVEIEDWTSSETWDQGGSVSFTLALVESRAQETVPILGAAALVAAAKGLRDASAGEFAGQWSLGSALHVVEDAAEQVTRHADRIRNAVLSPANAIIDTASTVAEAIDNVSSNVATLLATPAELAAAFQGIFDAALTAGDRLGLDRLFGDAASSAPAGAATPSEFERANNEFVLDRLVRREALVAAAQVLPDVSWVALDDAVAERDRWNGRFVAERDAAGTTVQTFDALDRCRLILHQEITGRAADLPAWRTATFHDVASAIEIGWDLYRDAGRCAEVSDRVAHPGFVVGPLQVLSA